MSTQEQAPWKGREVVEATVVENEDTSVTVTATDLVPVQPEPEAAVVNVGGTVWRTSRDDISDRDILIPRLRLAQGQTPEVLAREAQPGQWVLIGNEATDECEVVILSMAYTREYRTPGMGEDGGKLLCHAPDGRLGIGEPGILCSACALKDWREGATAKDRQPVCAEVYQYRIYDITHNGLALLKFQRSAINVAKMINTFIKQRDYGNFIVRLGSQKQEAGEGRQRFTFYKPTATAKPIDQDTRDMVSMFIS